MRRIVLLVLGMVVAVPAEAQLWVPMNEGWIEPYEPHIQTLARTAAGDVLAGTMRDGLYRSDDEGTSWTPVDAAFRTFSIYALASGPEGETFAATTNGVFRSVDGAAWEAAGLAGERLVAATATTTAVFVGSDTVYRSDDGGESWEARFSVGGIRALSAGSDGTVFVSSSNGLYRSTDDGGTWEAVSEASFKTRLAFTSEAIYAGVDGTGRGLYRSVDGGSTWSSVVQGYRIEDIAAMPDGYLLASVSLAGDDVAAGVYGSADGTTWTWLLGPDEERYIGPRALLPEAGAGTRTIAGTYNAGIYRATDGSLEEWSQANEGFEKAPNVNTLAETDEGLFATTSARGSVYRRTEGQGWEMTKGKGLPNESLDALTGTAGGNLLATLGGNVYRSIDAGDSWVETGLEANVQAFAVTPTSAVVAVTAELLLFGVTGTVYRSEDDGSTWALVTELPGAATDLAVGLDGALYIGMVGNFEGGTGGVYRSTDDGQTWASAGLTGVDVSAVAVSEGGGVFAGAWTYSGACIFRSDDGAQTWTATGYDSGSVVDIVGSPDGTAYAADLDEVYHSIDGGQTWALASDGLDAHYIRALFIDQADYLWARTTHGVFRSAEPLPVSSEDGGERPQPFALASGFPNPSVTAASIPFSLSEAGPVTLTIHDVLGRRVATLVDAVLSSGEHAARWDTGGVASGVYVVTLQAGAQVATQRITVAR